MINHMNRLSTLGLLVACLTLVSRGGLFTPSSALAQEKGQAGAATNEEAAEPVSGEETGGAASDPHESPADDGSDEDDSGNGGGNSDEDDDDDGSDEAANRSPAEAPGSQSHGVEAL
ncbi:MAG TPA: hypothetical protein VLF14_04245 [Candidatus Binatia bacterium]|nr:hypothetical protein [Candidatus Binatia bacterium]